MTTHTLLDDLKRLGASGGTRKDNGLPSLPDLPSIPARLGEALPEADAVAPSGGADMTLDGAKLVTSTDGLITISYVQSAKVTIGATTITIPAIVKTP